MTQGVGVAVETGGATVTSGFLARKASRLPTHRYPTGAERGPVAVVERILHPAAGLVDAGRADGATPRAAGAGQRAGGVR